MAAAAALVSPAIRTSVAPTRRLLRAGRGVAFDLRVGVDLGVALHLRAALDVVLDVDRGVTDGVRALLDLVTGRLRADLDVVADGLGAGLHVVRGALRVDGRVTADAAGVVVARGAD